MSSRGMMEMVVKITIPFFMLVSAKVPATSTPAPSPRFRRKFSSPMYCSFFSNSARIANAAGKNAAAPSPSVNRARSMSQRLFDSVRMMPAVSVRTAAIRMSLLLP